MSLVPDEIITEILVRLPARDLWRLRCISKSWRTQIDSPYFINMHHNRSIRTNSNRSLIFSDGTDIFSLHVKDLLNHNSNRKLNCCLKFSPCLSVFGSCNGLLLLSKCGSRSSQRNCPCDDSHEFGIWNPNNGEYKGLPDPAESHKFSRRDNWEAHGYGFGFDSPRDEYKVIAVYVNLSPSWWPWGSSCKADIYSLRSNSWKQIEDTSLPLNIQLSFEQLGGALASGALHWAGREGTKEDWVILAFDIGAEDFRIVAQPDFSVEIEWIRMEELDVKLCLSSGRKDCCIDIWIMGEYGVKESWTKLLSISSLSLQTDSWYFRRRQHLNYPFAKPLSYSSSGNKILLNKRDGRLILYDLATDTEEEIRIGELENGYFAAYSCADSLVRLSDYDTNC